MNFDPHAQRAKELFGTVNPELRQAAKMDNYTRMYGMSNNRRPMMTDWTFDPVLLSIIQRLNSAKAAGVETITISTLDLEEVLTDLQTKTETWQYLWRWVERGLFDKVVTTPKNALEVMAHYPAAPWKTGRWDVDHKNYADAFYKQFPRAKED